MKTGNFSPISWSWQILHHAFRCQTLYPHHTPTTSILPLTTLLLIVSFAGSTMMNISIITLWLDHLNESILTKGEQIFALNISVFKGMNFPEKPFPVECFLHLTHYQSVSQTKQSTNGFSSKKCNWWFTTVKKQILFHEQEGQLFLRI